MGNVYMESEANQGELESPQQAAYLPSDLSSLPCLAPQPSPAGQTVADLMTTTVQAIDREETIATALRQMQTHSVRSLIVNRPNPESPFGILTERDIVYRVFARGLDPHRVRVHDIMRQPCIALDPSLSFQAVAQLFAETGIQRAPVVRGGTLLGILSVTDLIFKTPDGQPFIPSHS